MILSELSVSVVKKLFLFRIHFILRAFRINHVDDNRIIPAEIKCSLLKFGPARHFRVVRKAIAFPGNSHQACIQLPVKVLIMVNGNSIPAVPGLYQGLPFRVSLSIFTIFLIIALSDTWKYSGR